MIRNNIDIVWKIASVQEILIPFICDLVAVEQRAFVNFLRSLRARRRRRLRLVLPLHARRHRATQRRRVFDLHFAPALRVGQQRLQVWSLHHVYHALVAAVEIPDDVAPAPVEGLDRFYLVVEQVVVREPVLRVENASDDAFYLGEKNDT